MKSARPVDIQRIESELDQAMAAAGNLKEGAMRGDSEAIREAAERYQRLCQYYGYLQTVLPDAPITARVAQFVASTRRIIYGTRLSRIRKPAAYLTRLRAAFHAMRFYVLAAIVTGVIGALFSAALVRINPEIGWHFLSEDTVAALKAGRLWTEGVKGIESVAAAGIMTNNISVSFLAFVSGVTAGTLTAIVLFFNGVHLGGIFAILSQYSMGGRLLDFIIAHGFLELSIIFVSGGAGFYIGDALIHPGELSRWEALRRRVPSALDIVLFSAAWLIVAGIIEGYISPHNVPFETKITLGLFVASVYWYLLGGRPGRIEEK